MRGQLNPPKSASASAAHRRASALKGFVDVVTKTPPQAQPPGVQGVHRHAIEWPEGVTRVVGRAGLLPRPSPREAVR